MRIALLTLGLSLAAATAFAGEPSSACRDGAAACRDAYVKYDSCRQANAGKDDACATEKTAADDACKSDASACDQDGSRTPPARGRG